MSKKRSIRIQASPPNQNGNKSGTEHQARLEAIRLEQEELKLEIQRATLKKATSGPCQKCASVAEAIKRARQEWDAERAGEIDKAHQELEQMIGNILADRPDEAEPERGGISLADTQPDD